MRTSMLRRFLEDLVRDFASFCELLLFIGLEKL